jgi:intracellular septation protein
MFALFLFYGLWTKRNFFKYVFDKTFHYTDEGWNTFTRCFAWFFVLTAVLNEVVRLTFHDATMYDVMGHAMSGINIWIAFKLLLIMPLSGIFAWLLTKWMAKHRIDPPDPDPAE